MKVSIIIPVYNVEDYIGECLGSVAAQDWCGDMECLIVDDCGTDSSMDKVERFVSDYSGPIAFSILRHTHNRGLSAARNTAMAHASGDYFFFLDSDDFLSSDCIRLLMTPLKEKEYDMVIGNYQSTGDVKPVNRIKSGDYGYEMIVSGLCIGRYQMAVWNKLFNRKALLRYRISFKEGALNEDVLFSSQAASVFTTMYVIEEVTYNYTVRDGSIMGRFEFDRHIPHYHSMLADYVKFVEYHRLWKEKKVCDILRFIFHVCVYGPYYSFPEYMGHIGGFMERYIKTRKRLGVPRFYFVRANGLDIRHQIQDFHCLWPPLPGALCYFMINIMVARGIKKMLKL